MKILNLLNEDELHIQSVQFQLGSDLNTCYCTLAYELCESTCKLDPALRMNVMSLCLGMHKQHLIIKYIHLGF